MPAQSIDAILSSLLEPLAAIEHERWSHWQNYLHSKCVPNPDGSLTVPAELVEKWALQASTPYADLTEKEQESDREQVQRYIPLIANTIKSAA
jgi:hypothetical protein